MNTLSASANGQSSEAPRLRNCIGGDHTLVAHPTHVTEYESPDGSIDRS